MEYEDYIRKR